jgi:HTH-type transcriptional regulator/antitoxin HigA
MPSFTNSTGDLGGEAEYKAALKAASFYFENEPEPGTEDADQFEQLLKLIQTYESRYFPIA